MKSFGVVAIAIACLAAVSAQNCAPGEVPCGNSTECVREDLFCDGVLDCANDYDESREVCPCEGGQIPCKDSDRCIPPSWICDGEVDCPLGDDENPPDGCPPCDGFECPDGECIPGGWVCDGYSDCSDGSDENPEEGCPPCNGFECDNGDCISSGWVCDGEADCSQGEDESECPCDGFKCGAPDYTCLPASKKCDGSTDCGDGSDEAGCPCEAPDKFQCRDGKCILAKYRCDKVVDCGDGSDEENCPSFRIPIDIKFTEKMRKYAMTKDSGIAARHAIKKAARRSAEKKLIRSCSQLRLPFLYARRHRV